MRLTVTMPRLHKREPLVLPNTSFGHSLAIYASINTNSTQMCGASANSKAKRVSVG